MVLSKKRYWGQVHQDVFDNNKQTLTKTASLAYPDVSSLFEINTGTSTCQLGAVIMQF